jgi:hypothetical protein
MARMIELIRSSSVPATLMQAAARGALSVPPEEMIEILVHLANHNKIFGQQARMTLAGWEEKSSLAAASNPETPQEVLEYLIAPENLRPCLLPALLENPSVSDTPLIVLAGTGTREVVEAMRQSARVQKSHPILHALADNPNSTEAESSQLTEQAKVGDPTGALPDTASAYLPTNAGIAEAGSAEHDAVIDAYLAEHSKELVIEGEKPFQPMGGIHEFELGSVEAVIGETPVATEGGNAEESPVVAADPTQAAGSTTAAAARRAPTPKKPPSSHEAERGSALQKISKLDVKGRIQLAMKGSKEERSILVRDGTKLVALAVLESGKITDGEVEKFASQKNVLEAVLRQIPMKRRFAKNYNVVRNLVANPRTPLDVSLGLMKNLLVSDLRNLSSNKEVSETIRKLALKMFKQKSDPTKRSG